jgi:predicted dehydrogenase
MRDRTIRIGVLGCGRIASLAHLRILSRLQHVSVAAVADSDGARREQALEHAPQAVECSDYKTLLERRDVDAVVICLPPQLHASAAVDAFRAGKHVYLEKPLALSLSEASEVVAAWKSTGLIGVIGFNFRHNPLYRKLRAQLQAGEIGRLVGARSVFASAARPLPPWKQKRVSGGGALLDLGSHHADITRFLFAEEVTAARATVRSQRCEHDSAFLEMRTASGLIVSSFLSMSAIEEHRFEIYGVRGKLSMHRLAQDTDLTLPNMPYDRIQRIWDSLVALRPSTLLRGPAEPSFATALEMFVEGVRTGEEVRPNLEDGLRSLAVISAAERSLDTGSFVEVASTVPAQATPV